jgi:hypothetical protein
VGRVEPGRKDHEPPTDIDLHFHQVTSGVPGGIAAKVEITSAGGFKTDSSTPATCS